MGLRHLRVFAALTDRFEIAGAYDLLPDVPVPSGIRRLRSEEEAIAEAEVVVIATPTSAHAGAASRALAAGRHVLVEKPLSSTAADARALAAQSERGPARLFVAHSERFNPVVRVLSRLLRDETPFAIDLLRVGPSRSTDGGALVNLGVHDFDLAAYLGHGALAIHAAVGDAGDDLAHVLFTTSLGAVGHLYVDRSAPAKRRQLALSTPSWLYEGDLLAHRLVRTPRSSVRALARETVSATDVPLPLGESLGAQAVALADALDDAGVREIATADAGAHAVALAEEAALRCAGGPLADAGLRSLWPRLLP